MTAALRSAPSTPAARPTAGLGAALRSSLLTAAAPERHGVVRGVVGLAVDVAGLRSGVGEIVSLGSAPAVRAEVIAARADGVRCMPLDPAPALRVGQPARAERGRGVPVGPGLLGRVVDALGDPLDGLGPLEGVVRVPLEHPVPSALDRAPIDTPLATGVRAIDAFTPIGRGQRIGLFAGSGVGKSSLLSMVARGTDADVIVLALIGERGREVREFIERDLGPEGLARSVVVVSTSDDPAVRRRRGALAATRIAEGFRDEGRHVLLMMDSVTRMAMAQREIGLSAGELPATRGYPPSTFSVLAQLVERAGTAERGSITGVYTVLVDGDDHNEPVADAVRSYLDGHIVLDRALAVADHHPAIDVLGSVSRVAGRIVDDGHRAALAGVRAAMAAHRSARDLIDVGAYPAGSDRRVDAVIAHRAELAALLVQHLDDLTPPAETRARLGRLAALLGGAA
ncbi:FliI/YscN family ATPase [Microcella daejeonensis]|uniref:FliI/YscN family ATPase n=1 Tax=Microcella daejeonensis TaxID=2994971 RepID=UPI00226F0E5F|nr:FliI/YscN family ATPase [Microcella daejeonensis]WAB83888.1 FliI/YscN family ATPase [Microcella daejeonensis]